MMTILYLITFAGFEKYFWMVVGLLGVLWMWKAGIIQELTGGQKKLVELRTAELTQARDENSTLKARIKELEEYNRLLILNSQTTMEVALQIKKGAKPKERNNE
jgi:hypothetical protein